MISGDWIKGTVDCKKVEYAALERMFDSIITCTADSPRILHVSRPVYKLIRKSIYNKYRFAKDKPRHRNMISKLRRFKR